MGNRIYAWLAPCPKLHPPSWCIPLRQPAQVMVAGFRHRLHIVNFGIVHWILYPRHLWHLTSPFAVDSQVIVGHVHSRWNMFLAVFQPSRPFPQSGVGILCCGTPYDTIAASVLLSLALFANGIESFIRCIATWFVGIVHLSLLMVSAPLLFAQYLNLT